MAGVRYGGRKTRVGMVVSDKMSKTVVVAVGALKRHPLYKKITRRVRHYKAHDEDNACQVGDKVLIVETRPLSRDKRWRVAEILATAALPEEERAIIDEEVAEELRELEEVAAEEAPVEEVVAEEEPPVEEVAAEEEPPVEEVAVEEEPPAEEEAAEEEPPAEEKESKAAEEDQPEEEEKQES
jgi:small subunit ribosomal protein S17